MLDSALYALGMLCVVFFGKLLLRKIVKWAIKFFAVFILTASALAQDPEPVPRTDSQNLAVIAEGVETLSLGLGIGCGLLTWGLLTARSRFDL